MNQPPSVEAAGDAEQAFGAYDGAVAAGTLDRIWSRIESEMDQDFDDDALLADGATALLEAERAHRPTFWERAARCALAAVFLLTLIGAVATAYWQSDRADAMLAAKQASVFETDQLRSYVLGLQDHAATAESQAASADARFDRLLSEIEGVRALVQEAGPDDSGTVALALGSVSGEGPAEGLAHALASVLQGYEAERSGMQRALAEAESLAAERLDAIAALRENNDQVVESFSAQILALETERDVKEGQIRALEQEAQAARVARASVERQLGDIRAEHERTSGRIAALQDQIASLEASASLFSRGRITLVRESSTGRRLAAESGIPLGEVLDGIGDIFVGSTEIITGPQAKRLVFVTENGDEIWINATIALELLESRNDITIDAEAERYLGQLQSRSRMI